MVFQQRQVRWARWVAEFVLIFESVYLAVFLESAQEAAGHRGAVRHPLSQLARAGGPIGTAV